MSENPSSEPTAEQLLEAIRQMKVSDLLQSTVYTLAQLGFAKLDEQTRDLEQARMAIEAMRALVPVLEGALDEQAVKDVNATVANLQLAYADAAG